MSQSLSNNLVHLVFSTKNRQPWLSDRIRPDLHAFLAGALRELSCPLFAIGSVEDHVHLLLALSKMLAAYRVIADIKQSSSRVLRARGGELSDFRWQRGYGYFSVSPSHKDDAVRYVRNQRIHHATSGFKEELRRLLADAHIAFDERYLWD